MSKVVINGWDTYSPDIEALAKIPGRYIVLEGNEGSGKTTLSKMIIDYLREVGQTAISISQPGTTPLGLLVRKLMKEQHGFMNDTVKLRLLEAARYEAMLLAREMIQKTGAWVIGDRHHWSSEVLQVSLGDADPSELSLLAEADDSILCPKFTIYLDVPVELSRQRINARGVNNQEMYDLASDEFIGRALEQYRDLADSQRGSVFPLNSSLPLEETWAATKVLIDACIASGK